ncbi:MAG TPA: PKD domain-containing protein [Candidatus Sumerlaeota bacterium]|nr:PKD domain-containing protein [Candidatus Sumerlaeota bacterium]
MSKKMPAVFLAGILALAFLHNIAGISHFQAGSAWRLRDDPTPNLEVSPLVINPFPEGSDPSGFVGDNDHLFFPGQTQDAGVQIFHTVYVTETSHFKPITDFGSENIVSSSSDNLYDNLLWVNDVLFFTATTYSDDMYSNPWKSMTPYSECVRLVDKSGQPLAGVAYELTQYGDGVFFSYSPDDMSDFRVWKSEGAYSECHPLFNSPFPSPDEPLYPSQLTVANGTLYFSGMDSSYNTQLWQTDGTAEGTEVAAKPAGEFSSYPDDIVAVNGSVYFRGATTDLGTELVIVPGKDGEAFTVHDILPGRGGSMPRNLCPDGTGRAFFTAQYGSTGSRKLFVADKDGFTPSPPINGQGDSSEPVHDMAAANGKIFVNIIDPNENAAKVSVWDGFPDTVFVDVCDLPNPDEFPGTLQSDLYPFPGGIVIVSPEIVPPPSNNRIESDDEPTTEVWTSLWFSDGTTTGTRLLKRFARIDKDQAVQLPSGFSWVGGLLYFSADDGEHGPEPWVTDLTPEGTRLLEDVHKGLKGSNPTRLTRGLGTLFFAADDGTWAGNELHMLDPDTRMPRMVRDIHPVGKQVYFSNMFMTDDWLFFRADDEVHGAELWQSDGTTMGTFMTKDIYPGSRASNPNVLGVFKGSVYFQGSAPGIGTELWGTDGNSEPQVVLDINPGVNNSSPYGFAATDSYFYFRATKAGLGSELWRSDGSSTETKIVIDIYPGNNSSYPGSLCALNNRVFFSAVQPDFGQELWMHDEEKTTTTLVKDILEGPDGSRPRQIFSDGNLIYFIADTPEGIGHLGFWRSDGTADGTFLLTALEYGQFDGDDMNYSLQGGWLYFSARTKTSGLELWRTNGTVEGTMIVKDIWPGEGDSAPSSLVLFMDKLYFAASHPDYGRELWETDGTEAGTRLAFDIKPGGRGSIPAELMVFEDTLYFAADDGSVGRELWRMRPGTGPTPTPTATPTPTPTATPTPVVKADFYATPTRTLVNRDVAFVDLSAGEPEQWLWDFGDMNQSATQNPVHAYDTPGTYTISLTVSGPYGSDTQTRQDYMIIHPMPTQQDILDFLLGKTIIPFGDLNGDGKIDVADLVWLILGK